MVAEATAVAFDLAKGRTSYPVREAAVTLLSR